MENKVIYLHGRPTSIRHYLRVGNSGHRQLEMLLGSGRMPFGNVVLEASSVERQRDLIALLKESGRELILDTNIAELSSPGRYSGAVKTAPWASSDGALQPEHFAPGTNFDLIGRVARFAVEHGFHAVHAPTHMLDGSTDPWLSIDHDTCVALRRALDREGGKHIAIDYPLLIRNASLRDPVQRRVFISRLSDLPIDNLWLRVSGFGADSSPIGVRRYVAATMDFLRINRPIVSDGVGGLTALAIAAFGAGGGISHGVAEKERFDASSWSKPSSNGGGGRERRVLIAGLDRLLSIKQMQVLMTAPGARKLLSCSDPNCCAHGLEDTLKNPKAHYLLQRAKQIQQLSDVPDSRRVQHFLDSDLASADRSARQAAKLKVNDNAVSEMLKRTSERLDRMREVFEDLHKTQGDGPRSAEPLVRISQQSVASSRRW